jgi:hypothetical protein
MKMAMVAVTTSSSIKVNAPRPVRVVCRIKVPLSDLGRFTSAFLQLTHATCLPANSHGIFTAPSCDSSLPLREAGWRLRWRLAEGP